MVYGELSKILHVKISIPINISKETLNVMGTESRSFTRNLTEEKEISVQRKFLILVNGDS